MMPRRIKAAGRMIIRFMIKCGTGEGACAFRWGVAGGRGTEGGHDRFSHERRAILSGVGRLSHVDFGGSAHGETARRG